MDRIEEIQERWLNEPLQGPNGENYASDYGYLLNKVYRQQEIMKALEEENQHLRSKLEQRDNELAELLRGAEY